MEKKYTEYVSQINDICTEYIFIFKCSQQPYLKILFHSAFLAEHPQQHLWLSVASNNTIYDGQKVTIYKNKIFIKQYK